MIMWFIIAQLAALFMSLLGLETKPETDEKSDEKTEENDDEENDEDKDDFDKERALNTIRKLRGTEKLSKAQAKQIADLQKQIDDFNREKMTDAEKLEADRKALAAKVDEKDQANVKLVDNARRTIVDTQIEAYAVKAGATDVEDVLRLIDRTKITFETSDDDQIGRPKGVEKLVNDLIEKKPYLAQGTTILKKVPGSKIPSGSGKVETDDEAAKKATSSFYRNHA